MAKKRYPRLTAIVLDLLMEAFGWMQIELCLLVEDLSFSVYSAGALAVADVVLTVVPMVVVVVMALVVVESCQVVGMVLDPSWLMGIVSIVMVVVVVVVEG